MQGIVVRRERRPSAGTPVRAMHFVMRTGEKTLEQAGSRQPTIARIESGDCNRAITS
jgi:hypothetical protein